MSESLLSKLPDEILSEILSYIVNEKPLLCGLALQTRHFSEVIRPLLFRCVSLSPSPDEGRYLFLSPNPDGKKFDLFLRSNTENPELALMVQDMSLDWIDADEQVLDSVEMLLSKLQCLRTLSLSGISLYDDNIIFALFQHRYLTTCCMDSLSTVNLDIAEFSIDDLMKYVSLPHLKSLRTVSIDPQPSSSLEIIHPQGLSNPTLRELKFPVHMVISPLNALLALFPNQTSLTTYFPGYLMEQGYYRERLSEFLSPGEFSQLSDQIRSTLTDLALIDEDFQWPGHGHSRTDLSNFSSLKRLEVPSLCYFLSDRTAGTGSLERNGIAHLLPSSLETIAIMYGLDTAICPIARFPDIPMFGQFPSRSADTSFSAASPTDTTEGTGWLMELRRAKRSGALPNLRKISLIERTYSINGSTWGLGPKQEYSSVPWCPPNTGFDLAGIEFSANIRALPLISKP